MTARISCSLIPMQKENINSDLEFKMEASQQFEDILDAVMGSQLNYQLQLSPFSATISVKKSFAKDKFGCAVRQYDRPTSNKAREEMNRPRRCFKIVGENIGEVCL